MLQILLHFITGSYLNSMVIQYTDLDEITKIVSKFKSSSSTGIDCITPYFIKNSTDEIKHPLIFFIHQFREIFWLKVAKIVPMFKTDDKTIVSNYRPIPVLPFFSRILEKLLSNRLFDYLNANDTLVPNLTFVKSILHIWQYSTYLAILNWWMIFLNY